MSITKPFLRSAYNYDADEVSRETGLSDFGKSLTKQQFQDECDINTIVRNFGLTGELPSNYRSPQYGDFEGIFDYQTALNAVIAAEAAFMELPANVRERFHHNPQALLEFVSNASNRAEAVALGLISESSSPPVDPAASKGGGDSGGEEVAGASAGA